MGERQCIDDYDGPMVKGIDVSDHNGTIDWDAFARSGLYSFAIARTGDLRAQGGRNPIDDKFDLNFKAIRRVGVRRGSYQFFRGGFDGEQQADLLVDQIERAGGAIDSDLPPAIDIERSGQVYADDRVVPTAAVLTETKRWLQRVESRLGVTPIIYTGEWWHWMVSQKGLGGPFAGYPLWTASYGTRCCRMPVGLDGGPAPWSQWAIWQHTADGTVPGIRRGVDVNRFRGDEAALARFVARLSKGGHPLDQLTPFASAFRRWLQ